MRTIKQLAEEWADDIIAKFDNEFEDEATQGKLRRMLTYSGDYLDSKYTVIRKSDRWKIICHCGAWVAVFTEDGQFQTMTDIVPCKHPAVCLNDKPLDSVQKPKWCKECGVYILGNHGKLCWPPQIYDERCSSGHHVSTAGCRCEGKMVVRENFPEPQPEKCEHDYICDDTCGYCKNHAHATRSTHPERVELRKSFDMQVFDTAPLWRSEDIPNNVVGQRGARMFVEVINEILTYLKSKK